LLSASHRCGDDGRRGCGQSRDLCFAAGCSNRDHQERRRCREGLAQGHEGFRSEGEVEIFADPVQHFRERQSYIVYDNIWDTFSPIEPAHVEPARDYDVLEINGVSVAVLALPGVTPNHCGYALTTPLSKRDVVFCGETIHSPGRMARVAPLQYDYNDLGGAVNAWFSAGELRARRIEVLLPSLGAPMLQDIDGALASLQESLRGLCAGRPAENALIDVIAEDHLDRVTDHVWMSSRTEAVSWYLISRNGKALVIDYGYRGAFGVHPPVGGGKVWHWPASAMRAPTSPRMRKVSCPCSATSARVNKGTVARSTAAVPAGASTRP